jgi:cytochrome bd-type quinol oxidase subunit 1
MYQHLLFLHSWVRWFVVFFLFLVLIKYSYSFVLKKPYTILDRVCSSILLGLVHLQFLLGLILYFGLSPMVQSGLSNLSLAMKNKVTRYWTVEHFFSMIVFVVLIQIGFSVSKRTILDNKKHKIMLIFTGIACILLMVSLPWPMREYGRALFRY